MQGLTGLEDGEVCRALLESKDWDLEAVAREHFGMGELPEPASPPPHHAPPHHAPPPRARGEGAVWRPRDPVSWVLYILSLPGYLPRCLAEMLTLFTTSTITRVLYDGFGAVWAFVTSLVGLPTRPIEVGSRVVRWWQGGLGGRLPGHPRCRRGRGYSPPQTRDPAGDVAAFARDYEAMFGPVHPPFHQASYAQVQGLLSHLHLA